MKCSVSLTDSFKIKNETRDFLYFVFWSVFYYKESKNVSDGNMLSHLSECHWFFIRFQNNTTLKLNFKRLRKWNLELVPHKCCCKMLSCKNTTNLKSVILIMLESNSSEISLPHACCPVNVLNILRTPF